MDYRNRRERVWAASLIGNTDIDGVVVTSLSNIRYLTGFTGSNGALLITADSLLLVTDGRYREQVSAECPDIPVVFERDVLMGVVEFGHRTASLRRWVFDPAHLSVVQWQMLMGEPMLDVQLTNGVVEACRITKDANEIALMERACQISGQAFNDICPEIRIGMTEQEIAGQLEHRMRQRGSDGVAFETIIASGPHSARPHHRPTDRPIALGDLVVVDWGASFGGYRSDQTRMLSVGVPSSQQWEMLNLVAAAQDAAFEYLQHACLQLDSGAAPDLGAYADIDAAARQVITEAGHGDDFAHGLGHGVGLDIHEAPMLGPRSVGMLARGVPVTVEPGVYVSGQGGVRWEDLVVGAPGGLRNLTGVPREVFIVH